MFHLVTYFKQQFVFEIALSSYVSQKKKKKTFYVLSLKVNLHHPSESYTTNKWVFLNAVDCQLEIY